MTRRHRRGILLWCAALLVAAATIGAADFTMAVKQVDPAVVTISTGDQSGSGFIFSAEGYVLTNRHVIEVEDADGKAVVTSDPITVKLQNEETIEATISHLSDDHDLCVLKTARTNLPTVQFVSSDRLKAGQDVAVIGAPLGLEHSVTHGIISALSREIEGRSYLQIDATLNDGNSGGPVIDEDGHVIGVTTKATTEGQSLGFAIPSTAVMQFLQAEDLSFSVVLGDAPAAPAATPEAEAPADGEPTPTPAPAAPAPEADAKLRMPASWLVWPIIISFVVALLTAMVVGLIFTRRSPCAAAQPTVTLGTQQPMQQPMQPIHPPAPPQAPAQQQEDLSDIDIDLH